MDPGETRTMDAVLMDPSEEIELDARLDEDVWQRAVPATNFVQRDPNNGESATERTEVRIVYNRNTLYMGVTMFDSEPDRLTYSQLGRDNGLPADDKLRWTIDTFLDGRTGYFFEMNPIGSMADALQGPSGSNREWDGIWNARAQRSDIGWTLEIEIPFQTLNFDPSSDTWGINFERTVQRKNEVSLWMGWPRNQGLQRMSNAGHVRGIRNVSQGVGLDIKPYLLGLTESFPGRADSPSATDVQAGLDLFYSVTPSLKANVTVNTDFAQTEVDQRQTNLTRFSLFFPEKRDFFLDGALFFDFASQRGFGGGGGGGRGGGPRGNLLIPFFSRRIGLANGAPQRIDIGAKLTGQIGASDVGVLQVRTGEEGGAIGEDFTVIRLRQRMMRESYVGGLYTRRQARGDDTDTLETAGIDFRLQTSTFRGSSNLRSSGYFLHTTNPLGTGKSSAFGGEIVFPNDPLFAVFQYMEVQDNYDASLGFNRRTGFRSFSPRMGFSPRPSRHPWIRRFQFRAGVDWLLDTEGNRTLSRAIDLTPFQLDLHSQDTFQFNVIPTYELLEEDFEISDDVILPAGNEYRFMRYRVQARTASRRMLAVSPQVEWGSFFSGDRLRLRGTVFLRAAPGMIFNFTADWNRVSLPEGKFDTRLYRVGTETQFNPWISIVNSVQFDSQSAVLGWQSRFRWIMQPGNDLYFVYIHNWEDDPLNNRFNTLDRRATSKMLYTYRF